MYLIQKLLLIVLILKISIVYSQGGDSTIVDPWIVDERNNLYNNLLNSTWIPVFGTDNLNNCLHGLQIQLQWQNRSGRLETQSGDRININSWWGNMNYYLSVIPYLSAMHVGLVPQVSIVSAVANANSFCTTYETCDQQLMADWDMLFTAILNIRNNGSTGEDSNLLELMWNGHITSIGLAGKNFDTTSLLKLPVKEKKFGHGWSKFVDIIAIVNFNTNYSQVETLGASLPPRMLAITDIPPFIKDFTKNQNNIVSTMFAIDDLSKSTLVWNSFISLLKTMTQNDQCKQMINDEISSFIANPVGTFITILIDILTNQC